MQGAQAAVQAHLVKDFLQRPELARVCLNKSMADQHRQSSSKICSLLTDAEPVKHVLKIAQVFVCERACV